MIKEDVEAKIEEFARGSQSPNKILKIKFVEGYRDDFVIYLKNDIEDISTENIHGIILTIKNKQEQPYYKYDQIEYIKIKEPTLVTPIHMLEFYQTIEQNQDCIDTKMEVIDFNQPYIIRGMDGLALECDRIIMIATSTNNNCYCYLNGKLVVVYESENI